MASFARKHHRGFFRDDAAFVGVQTTEVKGAPTVSRAGFDDLVEALSFAFALHDALDGPEICTHDFDQRVTPPPDSRREALAKNPTESVRQPITNLLLFFRFKHAQNAVDRL